jgi:F0F1-type ATP synthase membrane subunit b/b'
VQQAREQSVQLLDREVNVQAAQSRAANIIEQARQEAEAITREADQYVADSLARLEQQLTRTLTQVRNGINELNAPPQSAAPTAASVQFPAPVLRQSVEVNGRKDEK